MSKITEIEDQLKQEAAEKSGFESWEEIRELKPGTSDENFFGDAKDAEAYYNEHRDQRIGSEFLKWIIKEEYRINRSNGLFSKVTPLTFVEEQFTCTQLFNQWNTSTE